HRFLLYTERQAQRARIGRAQLLDDRRPRVREREWGGRRSRAARRRRRIEASRISSGLNPVGDGEIPVAEFERDAILIKAWSAIGALKLAPDSRRIKSRDKPSHQHPIADRQ